MIWTVYIHEHTVILPVLMANNKAIILVYQSVTLPPVIYIVRENKLAITKSLLVSTIIINEHTYWTIHIMIRFIKIHTAALRAGFEHTTVSHKHG